MRGQDLIRGRAFLGHERYETMSHCSLGLSIESILNKVAGELFSVAFGLIPVEDAYDCK